MILTKIESPSIIRETLENQNSIKAGQGQNFGRLLDADGDVFAASREMNLSDEVIIYHKNQQNEDLWDLKKIVPVPNLSENSGADLAMNENCLLVGVTNPDEFKKVVYQNNTWETVFYDGVYGAVSQVNDAGIGESFGLDKSTNNCSRFFVGAPKDDEVGFFNGALFIFDSLLPPPWQGPLNFKTR